MEEYIKVSVFHFEIGLEETELTKKKTLEHPTVPTSLSSQALLKTLRFLDL